MMEDENFTRKILEALGKANSDLSAPELIKITGVSKGTIYTMLSTLVDLEMVEITRTVGRTTFYKMKTGKN